MKRRLAPELHLSLFSSVRREGVGYGAQSLENVLDMWRGRCVGILQSG
jgi:hypothetical protein